MILISVSILRPDLRLDKQRSQFQVGTTYVTQRPQVAQRVKKKERRKRGSQTKKAKLLSRQEPKKKGGEGRRMVNKHTDRQIAVASGVRTYVYIVLYIRS